MTAYKIDDATSIEERLRILEGEVARAMATPEFQALARQIVARVPPGAPDRGRLLAEAALAQAQTYTYKPDPPGEYFQPALDTLATGGDCEDLSVVVVALMRLVGLYARLAWITQPGHALNHVSAALGRDDLAPIWADASIRGARLGESPYDAIHRVKAYHVQGVV